MVKPYKNRDDAEPVEERDLEELDEFWVEHPGNGRRDRVSLDRGRWLVHRLVPTPQLLGHVERRGEDYVPITGSAPNGRGTPQPSLLGAMGWILSGA